MTGPKRDTRRYRPENLIPTDFEPVASVRVGDLPDEIAFRDTTRGQE